MECQRELPQAFARRFPKAAGIALVLESEDDVVGIPHEDHRPMRLATPSSSRTFTDYSLPVSRRTAKKSGHYRLPLLAKEMNKAFSTQQGSQARGV